MKKTLLLLGTLFLLAFTLPNSAQAQCPQNADSNPCYSLPSGPCVCLPSGKLSPWLAADVITRAKPSLMQEFGYSLWEYLHHYYRSENLAITCLGGTWTDGQAFQVQMGGSGVIVLTEGL